MSVALTAENFDEVVLKSKLPVLVDFWAPWCGPCNILAPALEIVAGEMDGKGVVAKLNIDEYPDVAVKYNVMSIPTLAMFYGGVETRRAVGLISVEKISAMFE